jgi:hypothetical protein
MSGRASAQALAGTGGDAMIETLARGAEAARIVANGSMSAAAPLD